MADKEISALTAADPLDGTEILHLVQGANSRKASVAQMAAFGSGTVFPVSPSAGDRYFRTDRGIEYFYSATASAWLSVQLFTQTVTNTDSLLPYTVTSAAFQARQVNPWASKYDLYLEEVVTFYTLVGTGNWSVEVLALGEGSLANLTGLTSTASVVVRTAVNAVKSGIIYYYFKVTENSGTASFYCNSAVTYRLVG